MHGSALNDEPGRFFKPTLEMVQHSTCEATTSALASNFLPCRLQIGEFIRATTSSCFFEACAPTPEERHKKQKSLCIHLRIRARQLTRRDAAPPHPSAISGRAAQRLRQPPR